MNSLQVFDFNSNEVRTTQDDNGNPLFNAGDVCKALGIVNHRDVCSRLDDDEKGVGEADTLGGKQSVLMVNESGLYSLIFTSNKPEAKAFRKWVTSEVLPSIRKNGEYKLNKQIEELNAMLVFTPSEEQTAQLRAVVKSGGERGVTTTKIVKSCRFLGFSGHNFFEVLDNAGIVRRPWCTPFDTRYILREDL